MTATDTAHLKNPLVYADNPDIEAVRAAIVADAPEKHRASISLRWQNPRFFEGVVETRNATVYVAKPCRNHDQIVKAWGAVDGVNVEVIDLAAAPEEPEAEEEPKPKATKKKATAKKR